MISLTPEQRKRTALVWLAFSVLGIGIFGYLLRAFVILLRQESAETLDLALLALSGLFIGVLVLVNWLGAYCLAYRFSSSIKSDEDQVRIVMDSQSLFSPQIDLREHEDRRNVRRRNEGWSCIRALNCWGSTISQPQGKC